MGTIRNQLLKYASDKGLERGISTLDLMDLPSSVRWVVRAMMRKREMTYQEFCEALDEVSKDKRISRAELDETLDALCEIGWLDQEGQDQARIYRPSFGPKAGTSPSKKAESYRRTVGAPAHSLLGTLDSESKQISSPLISGPEGLGTYPTEAGAKGKPRHPFLLFIQKLLGKKNPQQ